MSFNDDQDNIRAPPAPNAQDNADDAQDDEVPDLKLFASMFDKETLGRMRRGDKDFESHGTRTQDALLEASRQVMQTLMSYERVHNEKSYVRGWYFPEWWAEGTTRGGTRVEGVEDRPGLFLSERVVVVERVRGTWAAGAGRTVGGLRRGEAGFDRVWLTAEEALFLVERGTLDLWWPLKGLEEILPGEDKGKGKEAVGDAGDGVEEKAEEKTEFLPDGDYEMGVPLSVEGAYSLLIGYEGERGKVTLPKFQVYAHLRRAGYNILRATPYTPPPEPETSQASTQKIFNWLFSLLPPLFPSRPPSANGPLLNPGVYRTYTDIFSQLSVIPRHKPSRTIPPADEPSGPYKVFYHVWSMDGTPFSKRAPPPPSYYMAVIDASETSVPTLEEITTLLETTPYSPPDMEKLKGPGRLYARLKNGHRSVVVAIVDRGLVNFVRFAEGAFGMEDLTGTFDRRASGMGRGGKGGGRGGSG